jgi:hypothetical protein
MGWDGNPEVEKTKGTGKAGGKVGGGAAAEGGEKFLPETMK